MFNQFRSVNQAGFDDLTYVYRNPSEFESVTKDNKRILTILYRLYMFSQQKQFPPGQVAHGLVILGTKITSIRTFMLQFSVIQKRDKEAEKNRFHNAPYYDWNDVKRVITLVKGNSIQANFDRILLMLYIRENVVRDNLGLLRLFDQPPSASDLRPFDSNYIYQMTGTNRYVIVLNDFKNVAFRGVTHIQLHNDTSEIIDKYIEQMKKHLKDKPLEYLLTKRNGDPYADGKLSKYIIDMFKRYTGVLNLGINELRHSVATHYKDESDDFKAELAFRMLHSLPQHIKYERHSNKVIKMPVFTRENVVIRDPFDGRKVKMIVNRRLVEGTVKLMEDASYKVTFEDPSLSDKTFNSTMLALMLENQNMTLNIGKRVIYNVLPIDISVYGSETVTGIIAWNENYTWDVNDRVAPYRFLFDDTTITQTLVSIYHTHKSKFCKLI